jgi:hypothetical protein
MNIHIPPAAATATIITTVTGTPAAMVIDTTRG